MKKLLTFSLLFCLALNANAQKEKQRNQYGNVFFTTNLEGSILSSSLFEKNGGETSITVPRFTTFLHFGTTAHMNINKNIGLISGIGIKNIGFIEKFNNVDSTVIRRNYALGIPLAIKLGDMHKNYVMLGGGIDIPFWFKEKGFVKRGNKTKINEWFSQRSPAILPNVFVGARLHPGFIVKATYYPTNFLNPDFSKNGVNPYAGYNVNLMMISVATDISYRPKY
ncbi:MAG TPA: hypothetical protein VLZ83_10410 [Edaphocola sp.]|nr:hypothetical protein [Edaphocola sp.]